METSAAARDREVRVEALGDALRTRVRHGAIEWRLSHEAGEGPDPVTSFLGALGSCLLMSLRFAARARKLDIGQTEVIARATEKGYIKEIEVELAIETREDDATLKRLVEIAERGCYIKALIRDDVAIKLTTRRIQ